MLKCAGVAGTDIMVVTGHRNISSLSSYANAPSSEECASMSTILAKYGSLESGSCEAQSTVSNSVVPVVSVASDALSVTSSETIVQSSTFPSTQAINVNTSASQQDVTRSLFSGAVFQAPVTINFNMFTQKDK